MVVRHCQKPIRIELGKLRVRKGGLPQLFVLHLANTAPHARLLFIDDRKASEPG
jgi:hypothetical protein